MAREFTCVSKDIARWLGEDVGVKRPMTQVYNGVDVDAFCAGDGGDAIRRELSIAPDAFVAGIVGPPLVTVKATAISLTGLALTSETSTVGGRGNVVPTVAD